MTDSSLQLQQENDRLQSELIQLRSECDRLRKSEAQKGQATLLSTVAQVANLLLKSPDYNTVLSDVVRLLGEAVECDRSRTRKSRSRKSRSACQSQYYAEENPGCLGNRTRTRSRSRSRFASNIRTTRVILFCAVAV
jgi:hypothetical protein